MIKQCRCDNLVIERLGPFGWSLVGRDDKSSPRQTQNLLSTIAANSVIDSVMKQLLEEVTENNQRNYVLFEQASDTLRDEIARWINPLVRQSDC